MRKNLFAAISILCFQTLFPSPFASLFANEGEASIEVPGIGVTLDAGSTTDFEIDTPILSSELQVGIGSKTNSEEVRTETQAPAPLPEEKGDTDEKNPDLPPEIADNGKSNDHSPGHTTMEMVTGEMIDLKKEANGEPLVMNKASSSDHLILGQDDKYGIWISYRIWKELPKRSTDTFDLEFQHERGDAYGVVIYERPAFPMENLKKIVLENLKEKAPDGKITFEQERIVNGNKVTAIQLEGTIEGVPFFYYGYLYSGPVGTIQVMTYTAKELTPEFEHDLTDFLNGFVIINNKEMHLKQ
jgi:hypothetical protein